MHHMLRHHREVCRRSTALRGWYWTILQLHRGHYESCLVFLMTISVQQKQCNLFFFLFKKILKYNPLQCSLSMTDAWCLAGPSLQKHKRPPNKSRSLSIMINCLAFVMMILVIYNVWLSRWQMRSVYDLKTCFLFFSSVGEKCSKPLQMAA